MDGTNRRPQLPALSYLDVDKVKREDDAYQNRNAGTPQSLSNTSAGASPTYHYSSGPPPPYSHTYSGPPPPPSAHANHAWPGAQSGVHTPPESRRTSEHEKEAIKQGSRQSLPSISEALGVDSQTSFATTASTPAVLPPTHLPKPASGAPASPSPTLARRSYPMEPPPQGPPNSFSSSNGYLQYPQYRSEPGQTQTYPAPAEAIRTPAADAPAQESKSLLHQHSSQPRQSRPPPPPPPTTFSRRPEPSPTYEHPPNHPAGSMAPPSSFPYGYTPYPPRYANPTPPASVSSSGPIYQPSTVYGAPQNSSSGWKPENGSRYEPQQPERRDYGESVKRHLEFYDLEVALNEIGNTSGHLGDFARRYGDRMHHDQRSGPSLSTLPGIVEVDDMVAKSRAQLDSLLKIRDVVLAQQAVYEQQAADQRQQHKAFSEAPPPSQQDAHPQEVDESKTGGFAGIDSKKRRGRAAPPGRCHSCNRAETPEWRRGPDGARTLCNACGLHYAKLTRKNNGANKNTNIGSSNLRPKENLPQ